MPRLSDFKGIHYGEAMVVCGLGRSICSFEHPERFRTIGVNDIGRAFQPSYLLVMDNPSTFGPERFRFIRDSGAEYIFADHDLGIQRDTIVRFPIRKNPEPQLDDPDALYYIGSPPTSPFLALCLAAHMGAKAIGLIGVDFTDGHFFAADGAHKLRPSLLGINRRFYLLGSALLDRGIKIFNLSVESKISAFPRLTADQFHLLQTSGRARAWSRPARRMSFLATSPVSENVATLARLINTETSLSCRLIAPNSRDIKNRATPEIEELVLANPGARVDCDYTRLPPIPVSEQEFPTAWAHQLRPFFFDDSEYLPANGNGARLPVTAIVSQANATGDELAETVLSLWPGLSPQDELMVVARREDKQTPRWLRASPQVGFIRQKAGESWIQARNRAASLASRQILLFTDANTQAAPHWPYLLGSFRNPRVAAAGPSISDMYRSEAKGFGMRWVDAELNSGWLPNTKDKTHIVPLLSGVFLAVRRSAFLRAGGFDPGMNIGGGDDVELCYRLWCLGWKCVVDPAVEVSFVNPYKEGAIRADEYWEDLLHNLLRLATIHFHQSRIEAFIKLRQNDPAFPGVCTRLLRGDAAQRRTQVPHLPEKWEAWFFDQAER
jgi:cellulose synthase/poly-beta-1,6-N-acetylglucosamine synthase-like glycosyltransferase